MAFLFIQDTGDTRETPAINVCQGLIGDGAKLCVYDPQVGKDQVLRELSAPKFTWDHPMQANGLPMHFSSEEIEATVSVATDPYEVRTRYLEILALCPK
jgi:UDPglucose 6-dehydrogenase